MDKRIPTAVDGCEAADLALKAAVSLAGVQRTAPERSSEGQRMPAGPRAVTDGRWPS